MSALDESNKNSSNQSPFFSIPPKQLSLLATVLGIAFTDDLDNDQQNLIGNFLVTVGQIILMAATQAPAAKSNDSQDSDMDIQIKFLKKQLSMLEDQVNENGKGKKPPAHK